MTDHQTDIAPLAVCEEGRAEVSKLHPAPGDILVVTMPPGTRDQVCQAAAAIVETALGELGVLGATVISVPAGVYLERATEAWLAARGLQRIQRPLGDFQYGDIHNQSAAIAINGVNALW